MKKTIVLLLAVALLIGVFAAAALAASGDGTRDFVGAGAQVGNGHAWGFVDAGADGINDNFIDVDGDGVCDNFVDVDNDGINDLRGTAAAGRFGSGACQAENYGIDASGDGTCDGAGFGGQRMGANGRGGPNA